MPQTGTVAKWLNHKGIGFITPEGLEPEENDILVHFSEIHQETDDGFKSLQTGQAVEYVLEQDPKNPDKKIAKNVTGPGGAPCETKKKGGKGRNRGGYNSEGGDSPRSSKGKGKGKGRKGKGRKGKGKGKGKRSGDHSDSDEE